MKKLTLTAAAMSILAGVAVAQQYSWDDGNAENSIGLTAGGDLTWLNAFQINGLFSQIDSIDIAWRTAAGVAAGNAFNVHIWSDPNNDGSPLDAVLLDSAAATMDGSAITANGDVFQTVVLSELLAGGAGDWFFVGASITHLAGEFPAAIDQTDPDNNMSWVNVGGPANLGAAINLSTIPALNGDWMVRANASAVPEPGTFVAIGLGLAGLALARRRK